MKVTISFECEEADLGHVVGQIADKARAQLARSGARTALLYGEDGRVLGAISVDSTLATEESARAAEDAAELRALESHDTAPRYLQDVVDYAHILETRNSACVEMDLDLDAESVRFRLNGTNEVNLLRVAVIEAGKRQFVYLTACAHRRWGSGIRLALRKHYGPRGVGGSHVMLGVAPIAHGWPYEGGVSCGED